MRVDMLQGVEERPHHWGGVQRFYRFSGGWSLSLINSPMAHAYPYAWEAAVLNPQGRLCYSTPLTGDVAIFATDEETLAFIRQAEAYFAKRHAMMLRLLPKRAAQKRAARKRRSRRTT
jgi:hypothetical protein